MIEVKNLSKIYKIPHERKNTFFETLIGYIKHQMDWEAFYALKDITFKVNQGEIIGLIGKNGSGKTTLLKILSKITLPTKGSVIVKGDVAPFLSLGIGFHHELTAKENLFLYGAIIGISRKKIEKQLKSIFDFADVKRFQDMKLKNFSSGMQARLAFSMMIQSNPDILLVDEILAVGDKDFRPKCISVFQKYKKEGKTVIFASHDLRMIKQYCDKVILLDNGKMIAFDKAEIVVNKYENL
ncbi:ABC transporter ATP-binding protein [Patescibacteria group bacterium]|nr:ABC transporter ATP-binding protein [Patescibacteria group bacterium]